MKKSKQLNLTNWARTTAIPENGNPFRLVVQGIEVSSTALYIPGQGTVVLEFYKTVDNNPYTIAQYTYRLGTIFNFPALVRYFYASDISVGLIINGANNVVDAEASDHSLQVFCR